MGKRGWRPAARQGSPLWVTTADLLTSAGIRSLSVSTGTTYRPTDHAFLRRETLPLSKGGRALLQRPGPELRTKETEGQMLQHVMPA